MAQAWFRFYSETLHDRKIERICRATGEPKAVVVGAWAIILALANDSPIRGALLLTEKIPLTDTDLFDEIGLTTETFNGLMAMWQDLDMMHQDNGVWYVTHFGDRQYDSDNSTERVQRFRERRKETNPDGDEPVIETTVQRFSNAPEQIRSDTDQIQNRAETETTMAADAAPLPAAGKGNGKPKKDAPEPLPPGKSEFTARFLDLFGAVRFKNSTQVAAVLALEQAYGEDKVLAVAKWAALKGMRVGDAISAITTALPTWGKDKGKDKARPGQASPEPKAWAAIRAARDDYNQAQGEIDGHVQ